MQETTKTNSPSWGWLAGWVLANFLGIVIGAFCAFALAYIGSGGFGAPTPEPTPPNPFMIAVLGLMILVPGILLSTFQSILIKNYIGHQGRWILITFIGFVLATVISTNVEFFSYNLNTWFWVILSFCIGILQSTVIRKRVHLLRSYYWILAINIQGVIAGVLGGNWIVEGAFYWGLGSILTGTTLIWLLSVPHSSVEDKEHD